MNQLIPSLVVTSLITAVLGGLALYGFRKKRLPLRGGGYIQQLDHPTRFRIMLWCFTGGAAFTAIAAISVLRQLLR